MALKIEEKFTSGISKGSFEYTNMAYGARYYNMDKMIIKFIEEHKICNIVLLGIGLETAYDRITQKMWTRRSKLLWYRSSRGN